VAIQAFPHPSLYAGDFNCWQVNCGTTSPDSESLSSWAAANNLELLHNPNGVAVPFLTDGTSAPTWTWPPRVSAMTTDGQTGVFCESFSDHKTNPLS